MLGLAAAFFFPKLSAFSGEIVIVRDTFTVMFVGEIDLLSVRT